MAYQSYELFYEIAVRDEKSANGLIESLKDFLSDKNKQKEFSKELICKDVLTQISEKITNKVHLYNLDTKKEKELPWVINGSTRINKLLGQTKKSIEEDFADLLYRLENYDRNSIEEMGVYAVKCDIAKDKNDDVTLMVSFNGQLPVTIEKGSAGDYWNPPEPAYIPDLSELNDFDEYFKEILNYIGYSEFTKNGKWGALNSINLTEHYIDSEEDIFDRENTEPDYDF